MLDFRHSMHLNKIVVAVQKKIRGPARKTLRLFYKKCFYKQKTLPSEFRKLAYIVTRNRFAQTYFQFRGGGGHIRCPDLPQESTTVCPPHEDGWWGALLAGAGPSDLPRALPAIKFCPYALFGTTGELVYLPS